MDASLLTQQQLPRPQWAPPSTQQFNKNNNNLTPKQRVLFRALHTMPLAIAGQVLSIDEVLCAVASLHQLQSYRIASVDVLDQMLQNGSAAVRATVQVTVAPPSGQRYGYNLRMIISYDRQASEIRLLAPIVTTGVVPEDQLAYVPGVEASQY